ncbi:MAG: RES domain-containing protein [Spiribacter salinus]|uniref:RES domain-containing protein n=1 Tax=Spiribacter salinus TaxID=1335746 RepID=A0A540VJF2_9GAMM|nr:MAG: RES domain-containing protein [Spiribacter salinus]
MADWPRERPQWTHHRVIHTKHPPIDLFESPEHMLLGELESATSDRAVHWHHFVNKADARFGPGWSPVMAAFCYGREARFNTGERGAYYAADSVSTALREWAHHTARAWRQFGFSQEVSATVRCYTGVIVEPLVDVRGDTTVQDPDSYTVSQSLGARLTAAGEFGILYESVRDPGHEAVALLRPPATTPATQAGLYVLRWDGDQFIEYAYTEEFKTL